MNGWMVVDEQMGIGGVGWLELKAGLGSAPNYLHTSEQFTILISLLPGFIKALSV